jgi:hypothetical protein
MRRIAFAFFLFASCAGPIRAQSTHASLSGRVKDSTKALIVDAKIAAIADDTNLRFETTTNSVGQYHLLSLPPASYRIEVEKSGFKKLVKPEVTLHIQDALEIDFEMTGGRCV